MLCLQTDKRSGKPRIWIYKDKMTGQPKGEATVTYDDPNAAQSAITWFGGECLGVNLSCWQLLTYKSGLKAVLTLQQEQ